jgi:hypothetical protein
MIPPPLNGKKDDAPPQPTIAGHRFSRLTDRCELPLYRDGVSVPCKKLYSDIAGAPREAVSDYAQRDVWCHDGTLSITEWKEIQAENNRIFACSKS